MEEGKDKTQNTEADFYRPQGQSSKELGRRLELIQKLSIELKLIRSEVARLGELAERVERVAAALRELREQERNPPAQEKP
jgi:hypothetical protein